MIDFRYHLVSLVAVFLALAIGIVMGAGPLRESLGEQLTEQVTQLREDRDAMRGENERVAAENSELAGYIESTGDDLVAGTLEGRSVVIVTDHESMSETAAGIQGHVRSGGGAVTNIVTLTPSLWDPDKESERADAVAHLRKTWPAVVPEGENTSAQLSGAVSRIAARKSPLTEEERTEVAAYLCNAGFIQTIRPHMSAADGFVYVGAKQSKFVVQNDTAAHASARNGRVDAVSTAAVGEAASLMKATVAVGGNSTPATSEGVVRTVRASSDISNVATVDGVTRASGPAVSTLALASAYVGEIGSYGMAGDASEVAPSAVHIRERIGDEDAKRDENAASDGGAQ